MLKLFFVGISWGLKIWKEVMKQKNYHQQHQNIYRQIARKRWYSLEGSKVTQELSTWIAKDVVACNLLNCEC